MTVNSIGLDIPVPVFKGGTGVTSLGFPCQGRLTITTGVPVTTANVTAATTLFFTPYFGSTLALYDGTRWNLYSFTQLSIAVPATTATLYDVFVYDNAGTLTLELTAWSSATARVTAIAFQNGVYVRSGATTRRYLGTFRTTAVSGQTEDSTANRFLWNYYNRVVKSLTRVETTASWTYSTNVIRQANANVLNQINLITGVSEDIVSCNLKHTCSLATNNANNIAGIGLDSIVAFVAGDTTGIALTGSLAADTLLKQFNQTWNGYTGIGYHYFSWLEIAPSNLPTVTWWGIVSGSPSSGITANILC